jgi:hypothetical protein
LPSISSKAPAANYYINVKVVEAEPVYQLRVPQVSYLADFGFENDAIGAENTYF